jgi:hypothetical protein
MHDDQSKKDAKPKKEMSLEDLKKREMTSSDEVKFLNLDDALRPDSQEGWIQLAGGCCQK